jgi:protein SCO1/2
MRERTTLSARALVFIRMALGIFIFICLAGCSSPKPAQKEQEKGPRRYALSGRVVSVEKAKKQVVVDGGDVPGFMMAMTMGYGVKDPGLLDSLSADDQINADIVVNQNDVWLENIVVTKKGGQAKAPSVKETHPASPPSGKQ